MRIKPNRTILEGTVRRVVPAADGWGADVEVAVEKSAPAKDYDDFLRAKIGSVITVFAAEPKGIEAGKAYRFTLSVLGGPGGERTVVEKVESKR